MSEERTISVDADALYRVLNALNGPGHYIRELQVTRGPLFENPIDKLVTQYNEWAAAQKDESDANAQG